MRNKRINRYLKKKNRRQLIAFVLILAFLITIAFAITARPLRAQNSPTTQALTK
jgi:multidrug resistance efflux pump